MSNQLDPFEISLNIQTIQNIDQLNLPTIQKHHLRILAHCLAILKMKSSYTNSSSNKESFLKEWCNSQSKKFNDKKFSELLYTQLASIEKKLNSYSKSVGKNIQDLEIEDLVSLVKGG